MQDQPNEDNRCRGCGTVFPPEPGRPGRKRIWCSLKCRKTKYDLVCVVCGGRVSGTDRGTMKDPDAPRCRACSQGTLEERFYARVPERPVDGCWLWQGALQRNGYATLSVGNRTLWAHRIAYELLVGPVPEGLELDHLCRVPRCVNPAHLEPVTHRENVMRSPIAVAAINARKTHCKRGHEFTLKNTYVQPNGARACRACQAIRRTA